jgi:hypothetical protein
MDFRTHFDSSSVPSLSVIDPRLLEVEQGHPYLGFESQHSPSQSSSKPDSSVSRQLSARKHQITPRGTTQRTGVLNAQLCLPSSQKPSVVLTEGHASGENDFDAAFRDVDASNADDAISSYAISLLSLWVNQNNSCHPSLKQLRALETLTGIPGGKLFEWLKEHGKLLIDNTQVGPRYNGSRITSTKEHRARCLESGFRYRKAKTTSDQPMMFECTNLCGQMFPKHRKGDWTRHEKLNFEEWPCPRCPKVLSRREKLQKHVKDAHDSTQNISNRHKRLFLSAEQRPCGFCRETLVNWSAWLSHVADHFEGSVEGGNKDMSHWTEWKILAKDAETGEAPVVLNTIERRQSSPYDRSYSPSRGLPAHDGADSLIPNTTEPPYIGTADYTNSFEPVSQSTHQGNSPEQWDVGLELPDHMFSSLLPQPRHSPACSPQSLPLKWQLAATTLIPASESHILSQHQVIATVSASQRKLPKPDSKSSSSSDRIDEVADPCSPENKDSGQRSMTAVATTSDYGAGGAPSNIPSGDSSYLDLRWEHFDTTPKEKRNSDEGWDEMGAWSGIEALYPHVLNESQPEYQRLRRHVQERPTANRDASNRRQREPQYSSMGRHSSSRDVSGQVYHDSSHAMHGLSQWRTSGDEMDVLSNMYGMHRIDDGPDSRSKAENPSHARRRYEGSSRSNDSRPRR